MIKNKNILTDDHENKKAIAYEAKIELFDEGTIYTENIFLRQVR